MVIVYDTWRAVLALIVGALLLEASGLRRQEPAPPPMATAMPAPYMATPGYVQYQPQPQPERPLRRVAAALMEVGDSVIGVVR